MDGGNVRHDATVSCGGRIALGIKLAYALANFRGGAMESNDSQKRLVKRIKLGRHQAIQIPTGFELSGTTATLRREDRHLILEPLSRPSLQSLFASRDALPEGLPPSGDSPADPVKL
jgi:virulence-associated protein VagC